MQEDLKQILITYPSEVLEREVQEILWGIPIEGQHNHFKIDSIPFYGAELSCEDIIYAEYDPSQKLHVLTEIITYSGNSTVQVMILNHAYDKDALFNEILHANTEIELVEEDYFVINVLAKTDYKNVYAILGALEDEKVISFAEPAISPKHSADLRE